MILQYMLLDRAISQSFESLVDFRRDLHVK